MSSEALGARDLARRLMLRAAEGHTGPDAAAVAAQAACDRACAELSLSLGSTGFNAILLRALAQSAPKHPVLNDLRVNRHTQPVFGDLTALVATHGAQAVADGLEATLQNIFILLGRLIGDDLVARLVERDAAKELPADEEST